MSLHGETQQRLPPKICSWVTSPVLPGEWEQLSAVSGCAAVRIPQLCLPKEQGSPEEQLPKHLPTPISCKDLQNKGMEIPCSALLGTPQGTSPVTVSSVHPPSSG